MTDLERARKIINEADAQMAELFTKRMDAVKAVAEYKKQNGLPIFDAAREEEVVAKNLTLMREEYAEYYEKFIRSNMEISKEYQKKLLGE